MKKSKMKADFYECLATAYMSHGARALKHLWSRRLWIEAQALQVNTGGTTH